MTLGRHAVVMPVGAKTGPHAGRRCSPTGQRVEAADDSGRGDDGGNARTHVDVTDVARQRAPRVLGGSLRVAWSAS